MLRRFACDFPLKARKPVPIIVSALVLAAMLAGCSALPDAALVDPAKYDYYNCPELTVEMKGLEKRGHELLQLKVKAERDQSGTIVSALTYEPEYKTVRGNMELAVARSKHEACDPPITIPPEFTPN